MIKMEDGDSILIERDDIEALLDHLEEHLFEWEYPEIEGPPFLCKRRGDEMCKLEFNRSGDHIQLTFHENIPV